MGSWLLFRWVRQDSHSAMMFWSLLILARPRGPENAREVVHSLQPRMHHPIHSNFSLYFECAESPVFPPLMPGEIGVCFHPFDHRWGGRFATLCLASLPVCYQLIPSMFQLQLSNSCEASTFRVDFFKGIGVGKEQTSFFFGIVLNRWTVLKYTAAGLYIANSLTLTVHSLRTGIYGKIMSTSLLAQSWKYDGHGINIRIVRYSE